MWHPEIRLSSVDKKPHRSTYRGALAFQRNVKPLQSVHDNGKPVERRGRKASGLMALAYDSGVAETLTSSEEVFAGRSWLCFLSHLRKQHVPALY
jgi:hypothetical protein